VAVALYCLWRSPRKLVGASVLGAVALAMVAVAGEMFWKEMETSTDYRTGTGDMRLELWKTGLRMWKSNPVLGVGAGNFRWVLSDFQSQAQFEKFGRDLGGTIAHSSHVEMVADLGSLGALAMVILTWSTWKALGRIRPPKARHGDPPVHPELTQLGHYADAIRCAILAVLVNGTFLSLFYYSHLWVLIAVGTALPYIHRRILQREATSTTPSAAAFASSAVDSRPVSRTMRGGRRGLWSRRHA
jgi:O-antigen ligase